MSKENKAPETKDMAPEQQGAAPQQQNGAENIEKGAEGTEKKPDKTEKRSDKKLKELAAKVEELNKENEALKASLEKEKGDYLRLMADFDNLRRHSAQEKLGLQSAVISDTIKDLLPAIDDCERALKMLEKSSDAVAIEGTQLIYNKIMAFLKSKGVEPIAAMGTKFDTDLHEAVAQFPVTEEEKKGMVIDVAQTGYTLSGKVIRYAKVVVGI